MIRRYGAHFVITGKGNVIKNGIISVNGEGVITEISQPTTNIHEVAGMEFHSGVLVPGFVNAHCHLELSHLKGKIRQHTGLPGFIFEIINLRESSIEEIKKAAQRADTTMYHNGIVAVGDIQNTNHSFETKASSKINYHNFIEIFTSNPAFIQERYETGLQLEQELKQLGLSSSIVPHAPYSVTPKMFELIKKHAIGNSNPISIHNQECSSENKLYINQTGELHDSFVKMGVNFSAIPITGKNSLESVMIQMAKNIKTILVHNTFSTSEDIEKAEEYFEEVYWCLCPNANLYIESQLPKIDSFELKKVCIGTDSLASNHNLSILDELKTINQNFPHIPLEKTITWATFNGAEALDMQDTLGSFEVGKKPGINLIKNFDLKNFKLKPDSFVKRLS